MREAYACVVQAVSTLSPGERYLVTDAQERLGFWIRANLLFGAVLLAPFIGVIVLGTLVGLADRVPPAARRAVVLAAAACGAGMVVGLLPYLVSPIAHERNSGLFTFLAASATTAGVVAYARRMEWWAKDEAWDDVAGLWRRARQRLLFVSGALALLLAVLTNPRLGGVGEQFVVNDAVLHLPGDMTFDVDPTFYFVWLVALQACEPAAKAMRARLSTPVLVGGAD
jgi:hypothetical protein